MEVTTRTKRVLLVDDQESFRSAARLVVGMANGFELIGEAETAEEALSFLEEHTADLVLMDINLPGMDGLEATRQILTAHGNVRVVVLSTYTEYESRALAAGAIAFVSKSDFGPDSLSAAWESTGPTEDGHSV